MNPYGEENEANMRAALPILSLLLRTCAEDIDRAAATSDFEAAQVLVDRVMDVLHGLVRQSRPPGPPRGINE